MRTRGAPPVRHATAPQRGAVISRSLRGTSRLPGVSRALGNDLVQRKCSTCAQEDVLDRKVDPRIQTKLSISQPGDAHEREADAIAEHVVQRMADPETAPSIGGTVPAIARQADGPDIHRDCDECKVDAPAPEELAEESAHAKEAEGAEMADDEGGAGATVSPKREGTGAGAAPATTGLGAQIGAARSEGRPLPSGVQQQMEAAFGQDFGHVRVHEGPRTTGINRSLRAKAFTHRSDIFFNQGRFRPETSDGQRLLAHELTHVVQQSGSRAPEHEVQRAPLDDGTRREAKIGNWAHSQIQHALRQKDTGLVTEAPIPGGTRDEMRMNVVGFADFYKSNKQTMSGIVAHEPKESKALMLEEKAFFKYQNMRSDTKAKATSLSPVQFGPQIVNHKTKTWSFKPNLPKKFQVGELKPLFPAQFPKSLAYHGLGRLQLGNYMQGFKRFAERLHTDNPEQQTSLPSTSDGTPLHIPDKNIPSPLNYKFFEQEHGKAAAGSIQKKDTEQRLWLFRLKDGLYVYFLLQHPYTSSDFPKHVDDQLTRLDPVLKKLREKHPKMDGKLMNKADPTLAPAPRPLAVRASKPLIQRAPENWDKAAEAWETQRRAWVQSTGTSGTPREFLKKKAKGVQQKAKVDKKLGIRVTGALGDQVKTVKRIRFWSGFQGRVAGRLYFRFRDVFDRAQAFFQKVKDKFRAHHSKAGKQVEKNGIFSGWKKIATAAIIKFGVEVLKEMLVTAFAGFTRCIDGIIHAILGKFEWVVDQGKEEATKEVMPVCCEVMSLKNQLEEQFQEHEEAIASFTETIETIKKWREILRNVEIAVRIGVQALSCATPPGLGCLWGLVAQLGIGAGLNLLARSDYFEERIAKPAARSLMDAIVGDRFHNFLISQLEKVEALKPFLEEASSDCSRRSRATGDTEIGGHLEKLDPKDPKNAKNLADWEKKYMAEILRDLRNVFQKGKGGTPNKKDFEKLLEEMGKSGLTPEELKSLLEAARDPASGKLDLQKATRHVQDGEAPEKPAKERDIDYEKATRVNPQFQKALGWKPETFYAKPGIDAASPEFADAVYDLQEALRIKADGILGEATLMAFYERNNLDKDASYNEAARRQQAKKDALDKARRDLEEKKRKAKEAKEGKKGKVESGGEPEEKVFVAIPIEKPPAGTQIITYGGLIDELASSPGWIDIRYGRATPGLFGEKTSYEVGERLKIDMLLWSNSLKDWVVFADIDGEFVSMSSINDIPLLEYRQREDLYFKLTENSESVVLLQKGTAVIRIKTPGTL